METTPPVVPSPVMVLASQRSPHTDVSGSSIPSETPTRNHLQPFAAELGRLVAEVLATEEQSARGRASIAPDSGPDRSGNRL